MVARSGDGNLEIHPDLQDRFTSTVAIPESIVDIMSQLAQDIDSRASETPSFVARPSVLAGLGTNTPLSSDPSIPDAPPLPETRPEQTGNLRIGMEGESVTALQENLKKMGFDIDVDGDFGPQTQKAVRQMQEAMGITVDGVVGPETAGKMAEALNQTPIPDIAYEYNLMESAQNPQKPISDIIVTPLAPPAPELTNEINRRHDNGDTIVLGAKSMLIDAYHKDLDGQVAANSYDSIGDVANAVKRDVGGNVSIPDDFQIPKDVLRGLQLGKVVSFEDSNGQTHEIDPTVKDKAALRSEMQELAAAIQAGPITDVEANYVPIPSGGNAGKAAQTPQRGG